MNLVEDEGGSLRANLKSGMPEPHPIQPRGRNGLSARFTSQLLLLVLLAGGTLSRASAAEADLAAVSGTLWITVDPPGRTGGDGNGDSLREVRLRLSVGTDSLGSKDTAIGNLVSLLAETEGSSPYGFVRERLYVLEGSEDLRSWQVLADVVGPGYAVRVNLQASRAMFFRVLALGAGTENRRVTLMGGGAAGPLSGTTDMALIPGGAFTMGDTFNEGDGNERPVHTVTVSAFYMDKYEVTKALWDKVYQWAVGHGYTFDNAGSGKGVNHPVHSVNWYDVVKWCNARSEKEGRVPAYYTGAGQASVYRTGRVNVQNDWVKWNAGYRLPTEAEWEKAARGGPSGKRFPWGNTISHSQANYRSYWVGGRPENPYDLNPIEGYHPLYASGELPYTSPVASFAPNGYGLYDTAGNVEEWCWDRWENLYYSSSASVDPRGPGSDASYRMTRGGGSGSFAYSCRSAYRCFLSPTYGFGFRAALAAAGVAPVLTVTPASLAFGTVAVGAKAEQSFTVKNSGGGTLSGAASVSSPFSIASGKTYSLGPGASQVVTVQYSPTLAGTHNKTMTFTGGGGATRPVSGTGYVAPALTVTPASLAFGTVDVGRTADRTFTVKNAGGGTLTGTASVGAPFSVVSGGTYSLAAGTSAEVKVRYSPTTAGTHSGSVSFTGGAGTTRPVSGTGYLAPVLTVTPASLSFGSVAVGARAEQSFTVKNSGGGTLSGAASVSSPFSITSGRSYSLAPGASQVVTVRYSPTAAGTHNKTVTFTGGGGATRPVSGTGYVAPALTVTPSSLAFGTVDVGKTADRIFQVKNSGGGTLNGTASVGAPFSVVSAATYSLAAGTSAEVKVRYSPTAAETHNGTVTFTGGAETTRPVSGTGYVAPVLTVTPPSQDFGTIGVGRTADCVFTVQNTGGGQLTGKASAEAPFSIVSGGTYSLAAGATQAVNVRYRPTAAGTHNETVTFTGGGGASRAVGGRALVGPVIDVTPARQDFGTVEAWATDERTFTVQNTGGGILSGAASADAPFSVVSGGTYSLGAGASAVVTVRYSPMGGGTHNGSVTFTGGGGTSRPVTGSASVPPVLTVTPASQDFGTVDVGKTADRTFTVKNTGGRTLSGAASVGAPFSIVSGGAYSLPAGVSGVVTVRYSPMGVGAYNRSVTFTGGGGASRPVTGTAVGGMVWIAPGTFRMGSLASEPDRHEDEGPRTVVTLNKGFWMSKYELTQRDYVAVMGSNPSHFQAPNYTENLDRPVERVSWTDAVAYCEKLTVQERAAGRLPAGYEYRLPTEAQWEYACRAGTTTATAFGDSLSSTQANFNGDYPYNGGAKGPVLGRPTKVGSYPLNAWGLCDMHGNVLEWCADWYGGTYPGERTVNPKGPSSGSYRVLRGGGWDLDGQYCRSAARYHAAPSYGDIGLGFRPALVAVP